MASTPTALSNKLDDFVQTRQALGIGFLWGFAEATLFFIIPDVYVMWVALIDLRRGVASVLAAVAGALVGGTIMYGLATQLGPRMNEVLDLVPLIGMGMIDSVATNLATSGLGEFFKGAVTGIPYKIYAVQAGLMTIPFGTFLLVTLGARLERILTIALIGGFLGRWIRRYSQTRTRTFLVIYVLFWMMVYVGYFFQVRAGVP